MHEHETPRLLSLWFNFKFRLLAGGALVGLAAGIVVVLYRFVLEEVLSVVLEWYGYLQHHLWLVPLWLLALSLAGWITGKLVVWQPMISGSGIPQVKGILQNKLQMNWWKGLIAKFIGGTLSIGSGLSLGREGPSIQIGASVGQGVSRILRRSKTEEHMLVTCGASAGLAAAFNAPIAGVIFALEEMHMNFSPLIMIVALASSLVADYVSKEFFGLNPIFQLSSIGSLPLSQYVHLIILGIVVGIGGIGFNKAIYAFQNLYRKMKRLPASFRPVLPFLLSGVLGLSLPQVLGGGNHLVNELVDQAFPLKLLLLILAVKFVFTMFSYGSAAPGGIFLPMLVIGGMIGVVYCKAVNGLSGAGLSEGGFLILAMAGYFTASVRSPITGIILITEMTGSFSNLLSTGIVCLVAYMTAELFRSHPIYEVLLERFLRQGTGQTGQESTEKVVLEIPIHPGSPMDGLLIRDFQWPGHCLIVSVKRGSTEIIPAGDFILLAGDYLIVLTDYGRASQVRMTLQQAAYIG
ncbi:ClC family H(+)/Cl(-) exchange transporter [Paenibacillus senegalimassiliensis]|uniref:ClC family H(+)/Cl(-) exchange transporter n=1 Tax=Paenibacillus senegalimassiliensis TaxID=1737426 RepID=UPI0009E8DA00|nr:ClC family H(+)/Cl(-) exchange transporter [Paenibacillus senegalimassiliensis]